MLFGNIPSSDTPMRLELEVSGAEQRHYGFLQMNENQTRLVHTNPTELLLHEGGLTKATEKMLSHFTRFVGPNCIGICVFMRLQCVCGQ